MRVVAGKYKSAKLKTVSSNNTRPTTDKVKESLFNMLGQTFCGGIALDLFAGSGSLGIEAISRGFEKVIFVDKSFEAIKVIKDNADKLKISEQVVVIKTDYIKALNKLKEEDLVFDLIILDPPYFKDLYEKVLTLIDELKLLSENAFISLEHSATVKLVIPQSFNILKTKIYGNIAITILKRSSVK